ncbi:bifunctional endoribonuclease/protein kinase ire1 [Pleosporales sp. CAS-2024a]
MPRPRRPPGAGPALTLLSLLFFPSLVVAAQQQQPLDARIVPHHLHHNHNHAPAPAPAHAHKPARDATLSDADRRHHYTPVTPVLAHHERAIATKVSSAPAPSAVRARRGAGAASGVLAPSARSLNDWEVEDFVLLATVDGHIHARDRYNGEEIWEIAGKPMLETIYNVSEGRATLQDQPFVWIVEPREDGALYVLLPGPYPVLQSLGLTVKQLTDIAPYSSDDPDLPVVYNVEKKTFMLNVDAATGLVKQSFSPSGTFGHNDDSCASPVKNVFHERDCRGTFEIGQTEYTITIHNKKTNEHVCTIKYAEWASNSRDIDLKSQYTRTMDDQYIYGRFNGEVFSYDHKRPRPAQRPLFHHHLPYPVARVFDVARPANDDSAQAPLVLLPQPSGPKVVDEKANQVWLNTTESGAWYALSEMSYPAVTDGAPVAPCYNENELLGWDATYALPADEKTLVGVHVLDHRVQPSSSFQAIAAPTQYHQIDNGQVVSIPPTSSPMERPTIDPPPEPSLKTQPYAFANKELLAICALMIVFLLYFGKWRGPGKLAPYWDYYLASLTNSLTQHKQQQQQQPQPLPPLTASAQPEDVLTKPAETDGGPVADDAAPAEKPITLSDESVTQALPDNSQEKPQLLAAFEPEAREKKAVSFVIPQDDEEDMSPLSRTTTVEQQPSPSQDASLTMINSNSNTERTGNAESGDTTQDPCATPGTPKKKKTHRGKRGGRKLNKNQQKDEEELGRIVDAAKQLDPSPSLHPDEMTLNGDDMQDVANIKRIGKLTIDQDRLLGNGSGGTFVFEGKWNEREVAIKRMLPQYFGLAEQEVKLLQESDLHPNVIRYFDDEKDENFLYIAVELCQASLFDLYRDGRPGEELTEAQQKLSLDISRNIPRVLYQLANGLNHLHSLRIIHRDIKPQNILIAYPSRNQTNCPRLVISDFGLCKTLPDNMSTLIGTTGNAGTVGWKAPELISQPKDVMNGSSTGMSRDSSSSTDPVAQGVKRAVDIFSLGCVFFYVLTGGCHPYDDDEGWMQIREYNIKKEKANLKQLRLGADSEEPYHLIQWMLKTRPEDRPTAVQVMNHPFFWSAEKRLNFLCDCSDHWEREPRDPPSHHLSILEEYSNEVLDCKRNFLAKLDTAFINSLGKQRKYTGDKMLDLLRALRNKKNHYEDMDDVVKAKVGPLPDGYLNYWTIKFPTLLMACYQCVLECGLEGEPRFRFYFEGQTM